MRFAEIRFDRLSTIAKIKCTLEIKFGIDPKYMSLQLRDSNEEFVCDMLDVDQSLGSYGPQEYYTIHIIDLNPSA
jgi:hypothetical protein